MPRPTIAQRREKGIADLAEAVRRHRPRKHIEKNLKRDTTKQIRREVFAARRENHA